MRDHRVEEELREVKRLLRLILEMLRRQGHEIEEIEDAIKPRTYPRPASVKVSQL